MNVPEESRWKRQEYTYDRVLKRTLNAQMNILLNGEPKTIPADTTAAQLIQLLELGSQRLALEVNEEIVPCGRYDTHKLSAGDRVEIVHAIGGG
jgi:sulfur carrier protein